MEVKAKLHLNHISAIDQLNGVVSLSIMLDLKWNDEMVVYDNFESLSDAVVTSLDMDGQIIPTGSVWTPDAYIYNAILGGGLGDPNCLLFFPSNGTGQDASLLLESYISQITVSCHFALTNFPFDTQVCSIKLGSFNYPDHSLHLKLDEVPIFVSSAFTHVSWEVVGVSARQSVETNSGYGDGQSAFLYSFVTWDITLRRYSSFYVVAAIVPELAITSLSLLALYNDDYVSRLSLAVTALLTNVATTFNFYSTLPVTEDPTWLTVFSLVNFLFSCLVCAETLLLLYLTSYSEAEGEWVRLVKWMATPESWYVCRYLGCKKYVERSHVFRRSWWPPRRTGGKGGAGRAAAGTGVVEGSGTGKKKNEGDGVAISGDIKGSNVPSPSTTAGGAVSGETRGEAVVQRDIRSEAAISHASTSHSGDTKSIELPPVSKEDKGETLSLKSSGVGDTKGKGDTKGEGEPQDVKDVKCIVSSMAAVSEPSSPRSLNPISPAQEEFRRGSTASATNASRRHTSIVVNSNVFGLLQQEEDIDSITYIQGALALDRIFRFILPVTYCALLVYLLAMACRGS